MAPAFDPFGHSSAAQLMQSRPDNPERYCRSCVHGQVNMYNDHMFCLRTGVVIGIDRGCPSWLREVGVDLVWSGCTLIR